MVVQIETQGQLQEFLEILRKRAWQVILPTAFVAAGAVALAVVIPKKYVVSTEVELRDTRLDTLNGKGRNITQDVENADFQMRSMQRIQSVVENLNWSDYLQKGPTDKHEYLRGIQGSIDVTVFPKLTGAPSNFVGIKFAHTSPARAVKFLKALRESWKEEVITRGLKQAKDELENLRTRQEAVQEKLQNDLTEIAKFSKQYGITQDASIGNSINLQKEDPVQARLENAKREFRDLEYELLEVDTEVDILQKEYDSLDESIPVSQALRVIPEDKALLAIDGEISDARKEQTGLKSSHSRYKRLDLEIGALLEEKEDMLRGVSGTSDLEEEDWVPNPARTKLLEKLVVLQIQQAKLSERSRRVQDEITANQGEFESRQDVFRLIRQYSIEAERNKDELEELSTQATSKEYEVSFLSTPQANPFVITSEAIAPRKPTSPNPWLIVTVGLLLGLSSGLAWALISEYSKNCFRSVADVSRVMAVPVLGSINKIQTRAQSRRLALRKTIVGVTSVVAIGSVLFVTWAWVNSPDLLAEPVQDAIEAFRGFF